MTDWKHTIGALVIALGAYGSQYIDSETAWADLTTPEAVFRLLAILGAVGWAGMARSPLKGQK